MNTPNQTRHERRRLQTRQRLIQAAIEIFLEYGYESINIQMITNKADLGRGTFYIHFKDKEDIIWEAIKDLILQYEQQVHREFEVNPPSPVEYFGLLNIFHHGEENRELYRAILGQKGSAILLGRLQDLFGQVLLRDIQKARQDQMTQAEIPDEILAQILTGIISRLMFWWLETPNSYTAEQMASMAFRVIYHKSPFDD